MPVSSVCAACGRTLPDGVAHCPACGESIPQKRRAVAQTGPLVVNDTRVAPPLSASLVVDEGGSLRTVPLGDQSLTLGRSADCDLVLALPFVSGHHARIEPAGLTHTITDIGSTNGLLFGGQRVPAHTPHPLIDGDILRIGDPATGNLVTLTYRNRNAAPLSSNRRVHRSLDLSGDAAVSLGRVGCSIILDNPQVSRCHAQIERIGASVHTLRDLDSTNGSFVNGRRVSGSVALESGDLIQIGPFQLLYMGNRLDEFDQRGALWLDARNLRRSVGAGVARRLLLRDVSLVILPREFVAIVGGSGTGKSTLLGSLSGYSRADEGQVLVNGDDFYANFDAYRSALGFVPQNDLVHEALTVEEALTFAAQLRLSADLSPAEIERRIGRVLDEVEISDLRSRLVAQLSGGQRRRVSIGVELLAEPSLFFLDEATSGLDPGLEKKLMFTLRRLADAGRTVVLVTHATSNITACDHLAVLGEGGRLVFFGPPHEALAFFDVRSGDVADIYARLDGDATPNSPWVRGSLQPQYQAWCAANPGAQAPPLAELWQQRFRDSSQYQRYIAGRLARPSRITATRAIAQRPSASMHNGSLFRQLAILTRRSATLLVRDRRNLAIMLAQAPLIGLLLLLVAWGNPLSGLGAYASEAKKILFMLTMIAVWCGVLNAAREIVCERAIFRRERLANVGVIPYVLSKLLTLGAVVLAQTLVLVLLVAVGLAPPEAGVLLPAWAELGITTLLAALAGLTLGLLVSALARTADRAASLVPLVLIPQILFAGLIFRLEEGLNPARLLSWFTISRWAMDAYGATVHLNALPFTPGLLPLAAPEYLPEPSHLLGRWALLLAYASVCTALTVLALYRQEYTR